MISAMIFRSNVYTRSQSLPLLQEYLKAAADLKKMDSVNISGLLSLLQEGNSNLTSDRAALASFLVSNSKNASENMRVLGSVSDPMYVGESETSAVLLTNIYSFILYILTSIHTFMLRSLQFLWRRCIGGIGLQKRCHMCF